MAVRFQSGAKHDAKNACEIAREDSLIPEFLFWADAK